MRESLSAAISECITAPKDRILLCRSEFLVRTRGGRACGGGELRFVCILNDVSSICSVVQELAERKGWHARIMASHPLKHASEELARICLPKTEERGPCSVMLPI